MRRGGADRGISLAELLAAFSLATDLGLGQPTEHLLRSWRIATRLAPHVGLPEDEHPALFFVAMLAWVGCVADSPELTSWFGDDIAFRGDSYQVELAGLEGAAFVMRHAGGGGSVLHRMRMASALALQGGRQVVRGMQAHCATTSVIAERLGLGQEVGDPLKQWFTRWDGRGVPSGVAGDQIALIVRLFHLADVVEVYHRVGGTSAAVDVVRKRSGTQFDPAVVAAFCDASTQILIDEESDDLHEQIAVAPGLQRPLDQAELDDALAVLADFTDLRSSYRGGHSRGVAELAGRAAELAGLPSAEVVATRRAALLHDIGLHSVPTTILDKAGALTAAEWERVRLSSYYAERVLSRPASLAAIGSIATMAHERMDGSGYHRRLPGPAIPATGRVLGAAHVYRSLLEGRAHRPALTAKHAASTLRAEVRDGRLDSDAADAVLAAAGAVPTRRRQGPAGLTPREVEVLTLIARGATTAEVAARLGIARKTAGTHIERIYTKTGSSSRSTATLFAMKHGLLDAAVGGDL